MPLGTKARTARSGCIYIGSLIFIPAAIIIHCLHAINAQTAVKKHEVEVILIDKIIVLLITKPEKMTVVFATMPRIHQNNNHINQCNILIGMACAFALVNAT